MKSSRRGEERVSPYRMRSHRVLAVLLLAIACRDGPVATPDAMVFKHGKVPGEHRLLRDLLDRFEMETGIRVVDETLPSSSDLQHQYFITTLEGGSDELDVLSMDVIWVPEFSRAGWLTDLSSMLPPEDREDFFPAPLDACTYRGRLYGVPWYIDGGVLYYRKDLLQKYGLAVPLTYPELADAALRILEGERKADFYGFIWQGKQYEGLVCVSLEVLSSFGGSVLRDGRVAIASPEARQAFRFLRDLLTRGVSPPMVTTADEEATRTVFGSGKAAFLRNWVYAWNLFEREGSPIRGKVGVAPIPSGAGQAGGATLGGWQLGIARQSRQPEKAWALIEFLTRPENQAYLTRTVGYRPSRRSLYLDPSLIEEIPILPRLLPVLERALPRPVTPLYLALSQILQSEISAIVAGIKDVDEALEDARREMEFLLADMEGER
ncbi:MAG: ABC transporter substrate-binding protein [Acidobacteriota bacterium]